MRIQPQKQIITDEQRARTVELYEAEREAYRRWNEAREAAKATQAWQEIEAQINRLQAQIEELEDKQTEINNLAALSAAHNAAQEAYNDDPFSVRSKWNDDDFCEEPLKCAASGKYVLEQDEIVEDPDTDEVFLRGQFVPLASQEPVEAAA